MNELKKMIMPWALLGFMVTICIAGIIGLFIGYNIAENQFASDKIALVKAQNDALAEKDARRLEAEQRNVQLETQFLSAVQDLSLNYKALSGQLSQELKQDIYRQCKVPASGRELLHKQIQEANRRK